MQLNKIFLPLFEISRREIASYFQSSLAYFILAFNLFIAGSVGWYAMSSEASTQKTLQIIFYMFSGTTMTAGILISMRLFAEEKARGTIELLFTSPLTELQMVLGKFFSAQFFLIVMILLSIPIPAMALIFGQGSIGHLVAGYIGVFLIGSAVIAIGTFFSTLTQTQLLAALLTAVNVVTFLLLGFFSPFISQPMKTILREFSFYVHYFDFEKGVIVLRHVIFFMSVIVVYLTLAVLSLGSRRWR